MSTKSFLYVRRRGGCLFSLVKLGILAVVVLAVALYFTMSYVADYALKSVTAGTPITSGLGSVYLNPFTQQIDLTNFYITNPQNYNYKGNAIAFKRVYVDADFSPSQFFSQKLVRVEEISVDGLQVVMTVKSGTVSQSNLTDIVEILKAKAGISDSGKSENSAKDASPEKAEQSEPIKFIVEKLVFKDADIKAGYGDGLVPIPMPSFEVRDLGVKEGGLTAAQLGATIMEKLTAQITTKALSELAKKGIKGLNSAWDSGSQKAGSAIQSGAGETEKAVKSIAEGIKKLF